MEENNKYYTPKITDIRIGYECEVNWSRGYSEEFEPLNTSLKAEEGVYDPKLDDIVKALDDGYAEFRTKYLSKEDIESEGWIFIPDRNYEENSAFKFHKDNYEVILWTHFNRLLVKNFRYGVVLFESGVRKDMNKHQISINEFRYITRELLGIE